jgi:hypothetical protein
MTPVYVGTDANISFQGTPRIESPAGGGPFDLGVRQPPPPRVTPGVPAQPTPINLAPGAPPSDIFRPAPRPTPNPGSIRPQSGSVVEESAAGPVLFDFDPASITLAPGEQRSVLVRATGNRTLTNTSLAIRFDPAVTAAVAVRPTLSDSGIADSRLEPGRVVIEIPSALEVNGTRPVAEIILQGTKKGKSTLYFDSAPAGAGLAPLAVEVR